MRSASGCATKLTVLPVARQDHDRLGVRPEWKVGYRWLVPIDPPSPHVSLKGVVLAEGRVLLARNHRDEWELPGGRAEVGENPEAAVAREIAEETGISVWVGPRVHIEDFEVLSGRWVVIEAFSCAPRGPLGAGLSDEHVEVAWFELACLPDALPAVYRRAILAQQEFDDRE